jgi:hypothetical protein
VSGLSLFALLGSTLWHCEVKKVELVDLGPYDSANAPGQWLWFDDDFMYFLLGVLGLSRLSCNGSALCIIVSGGSLCCLHPHCGIARLRRLG